MHHGHVDRFAQGDSPIHRLDARAKFLAVLAYTAVLVSFDRYTVAALVPMAVAPVAALWLARIPMTFALRRVLILSPFIAMLCLLSPLYDQAPHAVAFGPWRFAVSGGWLTAASVAGKFTLGVLALTALTCTTPFGLLLEGLGRLGVPKLLVMQLGFLYRYLFVLMDEAMRVMRARDFRGAKRAPWRRRLRAVGGIIASLFLRTLERSERIHTAMGARGYRGEFHGLRQLHLGLADGLLLAGVAGYLLACRWVYPTWVLNA